MVTPFYSAPPQRGAVSYFASLGARTNKPFLIYHIPARAGFTLTVDTLAALKDDVPHFCGLKNTDTDVGLVTGAFRAGSGCLDRFPRTISGVLPGLLSLPHRGWDEGRA